MRQDIILNLKPFFFNVISIISRIEKPSFKNKHFESSQKLRKDGIGILENFIENTLSNHILTLYLLTVVLRFVLVYCTC